MINDLLSVSKLAGYPSYEKALEWTCRAYQRLNYHRAEFGMIKVEGGIKHGVDSSQPGKMYPVRSLHRYLPCEC